MSLRELLGFRLAGGSDRRALRHLQVYRRELEADVYIDWLVRMIGGWLEPSSGNLVSFLYAAKHLPPTGAVVEIGSFLGASTNVLSYLLARHAGRRRLFNCDPWLFEGTEEPIGGVFDASQPAWRTYARELFERNTRLFSACHLPHSFELDSNDFFQLWRQSAEQTDLFGRTVTLGGPIAFAYVDGNHTYEQARKDVDNVCAYLVPGGLLLLDDTAKDSPFECKRVVPELAEDGFEIVWSNPNFLLRAPQAPGSTPVCTVSSPA